MRITFVAGNYARRPGGGHRVVYQYASGLAARGHEVTVVHPRKVPVRLPTLYLRIRRKLGEKRDWIFRPEMEWQHVHEKVNMLYVSDLSSRNVPNGDAIFATAWHTAPFVLEYPREKGEKFYLIQGYETWAGPKDQVDATWRAPFHKVVVAQWLRETGLQMGCRDMVCIPNAIDHSRFFLQKPIQERISQISYLYSPEACKGAADALEALRQVKQQKRELEVVFFGACRRPKTVPSWIAYYENPAHQHLVQGIYNQSSIFLSSSLTEGFPLGPAEAMACGCALVATDIPGVREYAENNVSALLSPARSPQALAQNLICLLENDELRVRIATEGYRRIRKFSWERSTDLLERLIVERLRTGKR